jgi:GNAT superfamily N-acetyltransferase
MTGQDIEIRDLAPGDIGWITFRQATLYHQEQGWDMALESQIARILVDFVDNWKPDRERVWVAHRGGQVLGCVMLVCETDTRARLRLFYVEPEARGHGLGKRLVADCVAYAREKGYTFIVLSTEEVLMPARAIYAKAGFRLTHVAAHETFGEALHAETWELAL